MVTRVFLLLSFLSLSSAANLLRGGSMILQCPEPVQRCGLVSVLLHKLSNDGSATCTESCVLFPTLKVGMQCGPCPNSATESKSALPTWPPSSTPATTTPIAPSQSPSQPTTLLASSSPTTGKDIAATPFPTASTTVKNTAAPTIAPTKTPTADISVLAPIATKQNDNCSSDVTVGEFTIELQLVDIPSSDQAYFVQAKQRWESVIVGDVKDFAKTETLSPAVMAHGDCVFPTSIDDMYLCASYKAMDGPQNIVGLAGPLYNRKTSSDGVPGAPIVGEIEFDLDDIESLKVSSYNGESTFVHTVLHEMGHVLGIGTNWDDAGLVPTESVNNDCPYSGTNANREFQAILPSNHDGAMATIPVEKDASKGACKHWSEECLVNELMTGVLEPGSTPLLSRITIGSLQDLGYTVDYSKADPYSSANLGPECSGKRRRQLDEMQNGEVLALTQAAGGPHHRRQLSDAGHQSALKYGRSVLTQRRQVRKLLRSAGDLDTESVYVGDRVVSMLILEGNDVYGVVVQNNDSR